MKDIHDDPIRTAGDLVRQDVLPSLETAYNEIGPATVLALTFMLADIWLESGFTTSEWRNIIDIYEMQERAKA